MLKQLEGPEESSWLHKKWNCGFSPHTLSAKKYPLFNHRENIVVLGRSSWAGCTFPAGYRRQDASQCVTITTQKLPHLSPSPSRENVSISPFQMQQWLKCWYHLLLTKKSKFCTVLWAFSWVRKFLTEERAILVVLHLLLQLAYKGFSLFPLRTHTQHI